MGMGKYHKYLDYDVLHCMQMVFKELKNKVENTWFFIKENEEESVVVVLGCEKAEVVKEMPYKSMGIIYPDYLIKQTMVCLAEQLEEKLNESV